MLALCVILYIWHIPGESRLTPYIHISMYAIIGLFHVVECKSRCSDFKGLDFMYLSSSEHVVVKYWRSLGMGSECSERG